MFILLAALACRTEPPPQISTMVLEAPSESGEVLYDDPRPGAVAGLAALQQVGVLGSFSIPLTASARSLLLTIKGLHSTIPTHREYVFWTPSQDLFLIDFKDGHIRWSLKDGEFRISRGFEREPKPAFSHLQSLAELLQSARDPNWTEALQWRRGPPAGSRTVAPWVWDEAVLPDAWAEQTRVWLMSDGERLHTLVIHHQARRFHLPIFYGPGPAPFMDIDTVAQASGAPWSRWNGAPSRNPETVESARAQQAMIRQKLDAYGPQ